MNRRRWLWLVALVLVAAVVFHQAWLAALGRFLIDAEPPQKADLIVVLAGDWNGYRILYGGELVRQGYAPKALVSGPRHHYGLYEYELAITFAVRHGYPADSFIPLPIADANSTREEAERILPEIRRRGARRVLVVTSDYHTRRSSRIYHRLAPDLDLRVVAAPDAVFRADRWWNNREASKVFLLEFTKLVSSVFGI